MVAMLMSAPARAQGSGGGTGGGTVVESRVSGYTVQTGDWRLKPTIDPTAIGSTGQPGRVNSMIAVIRPEAAVGNNIRVIWFQRAADDSWSARAWTDADIGPALSYIKQHANFPDEDNDAITYGLLWPIGELGDNGNPNGVGPGVPQSTDWMNAGPILGEGYANGFLQGDPMAQLITTLPDRDPVVSLFTDSGYESADLVFEQSRFATGCTNNAAIRAFTAGAEILWQAPAAIDVSIAASDAALGTYCVAQTTMSSAIQRGCVHSTSCDQSTPWTECPGNGQQVPGYSNPPRYVCCFERMMPCHTLTVCWEIGPDGSDRVTSRFTTPAPWTHQRRYSEVGFGERCDRP
jgi:hypothetical protein